MCADERPHLPGAGALNQNPLCLALKIGDGSGMKSACCSRSSPLDVLSNNSPQALWLIDPGLSSFLSSGLKLHHKTVGFPPGSGHYHIRRYVLFDFSALAVCVVSPVSTKSAIKEEVSNSALA